MDSNRLGNLPEGGKVLVWRLSAFGDVILTTPLLALLQIYRPDLEIHYGVKSTCAAAIAHHPYISLLIRVERLNQSLIEQLLQADYNAVFDCQANVASQKLFRRLSCSVYRVDKCNWDKFRMTAFKYRLQIPHIVERYCRVLGEVGIKAAPGPLHYEIPTQAAHQADNFIQTYWHIHDTDRGPLALVLGASYATKQWLAEHWVELITRVPYPVILLGGPADQAIARRIRLQLPKHSTNRVLDAVGQFDFTTSAALLDRCIAVVTHDTGLMHVAAARQKPIVVLWGSTVPELGMEPWKTPHRNVGVSGLWCRPCSKLGYARCPLGHFNCMKKLSVESVEQALYSLLEETGRLNQ